MCTKVINSDTGVKERFLCSECGQPCLPRVSGKLNELITARGGIGVTCNEFGCFRGMARPYLTFRVNAGKTNTLLCASFCD